MKRTDEAHYRELVARARALLTTFDEDRILRIQALLEQLLGSDHLDPRALAELEQLIEAP